MEVSMTNFDYYANTNSFLAWALLTMLGQAKEAGRDDEENFYEELKDRSNIFTEVELSIKLNGLDVDAAAFMARIEKAMELDVERKVAEKLEGIREITEVEDELAELRDVLKQRVNQLAAKYDIELYRED
jgi:hypothetical protein